MSTKQAPARRARKTQPKEVSRDAPEPAAPATPAAPAPAPVVAPVAPAPVAEPVAAPVEATEDSAKKVSGVRTARIRSAIDENGINKVINLRLEPFRAFRKEYKLKESQLKNGTVPEVKEVDGKKVVGTRSITAEERAALTTAVAVDKARFEAAGAEIAAHKSCRMRFSAAAPEALTVVCDYVINSLFQFGAKNLGEKENILHVEHFARCDVRSLDVYPLIKNLPAFSSALEAEHVKTMTALHARELAAARKEAIKKFREDHNIVVHRNKGPKPEPAAAPEVKVEVAKPEKVKFVNPFKVYIVQIWKNHPSNTRASKTKLSTEVKNLLATVVSQLIVKSWELFEHAALAQNIKTITGNAVRDAIESLFIVHGVERTEECFLQPGEVVDPAALAAEKAKKKEAEGRGEKYVINQDKLPKTSGNVIVRKVRFVSAGLNAISEELRKVLK
jgi:hypothetical protein